MKGNTMASSKNLLVLKRFMFWVFFLSTSSVVAQAQPPKKFRIKPGEIATKTIPFKEQYANTEFKEGKVLYVDGKTTTALLNFNLLYTEMEFIDSSGDTLAIGVEDLVRNILLGEQLYYFDYSFGYLLLVNEYPSLKLAEKKGLALLLKDSEKYVNPRYDHFSKLAENSFTNQDRNNFSSYTYRQMYTQPAKNDFYLLESSSYFFVDKNERAYRANPKNLFKIFPEHKSTIKNYLKENNINFRDKADLEKLTEYIHKANFQ